MFRKLVQSTIKKTLFFEGIGVHSGAYCSVRLNPQSVNTGILFVNNDFPGEFIKVGTAVPESSAHATVLKASSFRVSTVEHLMAALGFAGVDNVLIEVAGGEVPILDGSALPFVLGILHTGLVEQGEGTGYLRPKSRIEITDAQGRFIHVEPLDESDDFGPQLSLSYSAELYKANNTVKCDVGYVSSDFFGMGIIPARTFGSIEQLPFLRSHSLAQGAFLGNTLVFSSERVINGGRYDDEWLRHKMLDFLGDLMLLGRPLSAKVTAHKTGHSFNRMLIEHFYNHPEMWVVTT